MAVHPPARRARPTDHPDPNRHAYTVPQAPDSPACTPTSASTGSPRASTRRSSPTSTATASPTSSNGSQGVAEHVYEVENEKLGWRDPKSDGTVGGGNGKTDVYLAEIGGSLFGYAAPDRGQASKGHRLPRRLHGYLVLDNDYSPFEFPGTKPIHDLEVTFAHEYNHILQFGYDAYQDAWFAESTATWMEDQVYNGINDYLRYVRRWETLYDMPMTASSIKEYGSAVWNQWLAHRYGRDIIRQRLGGRDPRPARAASRSPPTTARSAPPDLRLRPRLRPLRPRRRRVAHRQRLPRGLALPRHAAPGQPACSAARPAAAASTTRPSSCSASTPRPAAPWSSKRPRRSATPPGSPWSAGSAASCTAGSSRTFDYRPKGGDLTVRLADPGRFSRITAVLINADTTAIGFSARRLDWHYLTDTAPFRARARVER